MGNTEVKHEVKGVDFIIYILQLVKGKYYVGKTNNIKRRLEQHRSGEGSAWTKKYPPLKANPLEIYDSVSTLDEDYYVKITMLQRGIENVRGGSYLFIVLTRNQLDLLNIEFSTANDVCFKCNRPGHFSRDCPLTIQSSNRKYRTKRDLSLTCTKCKKIGHKAETCYVKVV